jgi:hypothetical protein
MLRGPEQETEEERRLPRPGRPAPHVEVAGREACAERVDEIVGVTSGDRADGGLGSGRHRGQSKGGEEVR